MEDFIFYVAVVTIVLLPLCFVFLAPKAKGWRYVPAKALHLLSILAAMVLLAAIAFLPLGVEIVPVVTVVFPIVCGVYGLTLLAYAIPLLVTFLGKKKADAPATEKS